jgi:hypothetical protein
LRFLDSGSEKQGLTGRGKAIAATGTGRPPMAMALAKGACIYVPYTFLSRPPVPMRKQGDR